MRTLLNLNACYVSSSNLVVNKHVIGQCALKAAMLKAVELRLGSKLKSVSYSCLFSIEAADAKVDRIPQKNMAIFQVCSLM